MTEHWIVYRDVMNFPRKQFEVINVRGAGKLLIKDQVIPGAFGFSPTHIKRHRFVVHGATVNLITYTEVELSDAEAVRIAAEGLKHVHDR